MAPNLLDLAATVQTAANLPVRARGSSHVTRPGAASNDLGVASWNIWEAQARTVPIRGLRWPQSNET